ncbi:MaoC/PaaZ C-terminal domain-containing protein [Cytobacillus purgationiresistens]|uniref:Acyl dehydratase n=1 Tax=Cytobacillus purgationiresistens TaxID=863449 RepID=A0ABU0AEJ5_9BACI|nr:MaoC/PaaZ C-terminal domain-containing protein [Cytobacillus purgationiresistens]MDQ0269678.1 acyl dehydratase [Cytobacillus purgationiresistens]
MLKYYEDADVDSPFPALTKDPISRVQLVKYAGASGDFNPLHTVEEVGEEAGSGIIAHGMLIMGMASQGVTSWIERKNIESIRVRFQKMTYPGEQIHVIGKVLKKEENNLIIGEVKAVNETGEVKVSGVFEARLPSKEMEG